MSNERDIEYLLDKYKTKQPGEFWSPRTEGEYVREYNYKQKIFLFDSLNKNFLKGTEKDRAEYLIKHFDFNSLGKYTTSEIITMIMLYVKLESPSNKYKDFDYYLKSRNISESKFINFLIKLNKHHANHSYL